MKLDTFLTSTFHEVYSSVLSCFILSLIHCTTRKYFQKNMRLESTCILLHMNSPFKLSSQKDDKKLYVEDIEYSEEMIELEYLMATTDVMEGNRKEERKHLEKTRLAALLIGIGIEADLPPEFFEKLLHSKRTKVLLRNLTEDRKTKRLINQLNKY